MRTTDEQLKIKQEQVNALIGYTKYVVNNRYNYYAIDIYDLKGKVSRTYDSGLTKSKVHDVLCHIEEGIRTAYGLLNN